MKDEPAVTNEIQEYEASVISNLLEEASDALHRRSDQSLRILSTLVEQYEDELVTFTDVVAIIVNFTDEVLSEIDQAEESEFDAMAQDAQPQEELG